MAEIPEPLSERERKILSKLIPGWVERTLSDRELRKFKELESRQAYWFDQRRGVQDLGEPEPFDLFEGTEVPAYEDPFAPITQQPAVVPQAPPPQPPLMPLAGQEIAAQAPGATTSPHIPFGDEFYGMQELSQPWVAPGQEFAPGQGDFGIGGLEMTGGPRATPGTVPQMGTDPISQQFSQGLSEQRLMERLGGGVPPAAAEPSGMGRLLSALGPAEAAAADFDEDLYKEVSAALGDETQDQPFGVMAPENALTPETDAYKQHKARFEEQARRTRDAERLLDKIAGSDKLPHDEKIGWFRNLALQAGAAAHDLGLDPTGRGLAKGKGDGLEKLSATERQGLAELSDSVSMMDELRKDLESPEWEPFFGWGTLGEIGRAVEDFWPGTGDVPGSEVNKRRMIVARMKDVTMRFQRAISGAQMTEQEREFMQQFLPRIQDDITTAKQKAADASYYLNNALERRTAALRGAGYNVPDVIGEMKKRPRREEIGTAGRQGQTERILVAPR